MKLSRYIVPAVLIVLIASFVSCSRVRTEEVRNTITAADSLLTTAPHAALDTLLSIDSVTVAKLSGNLRADYALLLAEAEYKCYEPLADNEDDLIYAVNRFRKHGPEEDYARALMMQGAMLYEKGDAEAALQSYKAAEPFWEKLGDLEQLGLLHTRIGELYGHSMVNNAESISRYKSAIECFDKAGKKERKTVLTLALASKYISADSLEAGYTWAMQGLEVANELCDTGQILYAQSLLAYYYSNLTPPDYAAAVRTALGALGIPGVLHSEDHAVIEDRNTLYYILADGYVRNGDADSARHYLQGIDVTGEKEQYELFYLASRISGLEGDSVAYYRNRMKADSISYNIQIRGHKQQLRNTELQAENLRVKEEHRITKIRLAVFIFMWIAAILTVTVLLLVIHFLKKRHEDSYQKSISIINSLNADKGEKEQELAASARLSESLQRRLEQKETQQANLKSITSKLLKMTDELCDTYYRYGSSSSLPSRIQKTINSYFPQGKTQRQILEIVEAAYPGFIGSLSRRYNVNLTEKNKCIIAFIACGFSTGAICGLFDISENTLNVAKTRIAKKLGLGSNLPAILFDTLSSDGYL